MVHEFNSRASFRAVTCLLALQRRGSSWSCWRYVDPKGKMDFVGVSDTKPLFRAVAKPFALQNWRIWGLKKEINSLMNGRLSLPSAPASKDDLDDERQLAQLAVKGLNMKAEPYIPTEAARLTSELYTTKNSHRRLQIAFNQSSDR